MKTLVVMVKEPRPGRVKTRLGHEIGMTKAAWWFRHQTGEIFRRLRDPRWQIVLAVSPDIEGALSRIWPPDLARIPQGSGDLGDRMGRILRHFAPSPTCIIGADIPGIERAHIADAFHQLGAHDAVFGPAQDGGYWLVGTQCLTLPKTLFQNVRWSTEHALQDTLATIPDLSIARIATLRDVDTRADLD